MSTLTSPTTTAVKTQMAESQILQLLTHGGYHRAGIHTIPIFDRIAGGLVWAIRHAHQLLHININIIHHTKNTTDI
ncbi:CCDC93 [Trypanosoma melophagium]|uniref:CCDC93 n=1 Tax=Trypanosoma melophagium TaxID=715481 RepID=UPI00351A79F6|nr:CCDC93 [Trypanosoma melophagium]